MKRVYFIDYENVDTTGLDGLSGLTSQDQVYIYYSEAHSRMSFGLHRRICESKSEFIYRKIKDKSKNALDNELMREAETVIDDYKVDYYIISSDKGYSSFVEEKVQSGYKVNQFSVILETNRQKKDELKNIIRYRLKNNKNYPLEVSEDEIDKIASMIMKANNKSELNLGLQQMFYNKDVKYIFSRIKDITYNM